MTQMQTDSCPRASGVFRGKTPPSPAAAEVALTAREVEVLRCVAAGQPNKRIARELHIARLTVKTHISNIMGKLKASCRTHAVIIAFKRGVIDL